MVDRLEAAATRMNARLYGLYGGDVETMHRARFVLVVALALTAMLVVMNLVFAVGSGWLYDFVTAVIVIVGGVCMGVLMLLAARLVLTGYYLQARWLVTGTMAVSVILTIVFFGTVVASPALVTLVVPVIVAYCTMPRREALVVAWAMGILPIAVHLVSRAVGFAIPDYTSLASPELNVMGSIVAAISIATVCMAAQARSHHALVEALAQERRKFAELADRDQLTGLANRRSFERELRNATRATEDQRNDFVLLFLDLDRFKPVNDTHGHEVGDVVLRTIARRLEKVVRDTDFVARFGGDEFAIIARTVDGKMANDLITRLQDSVMEPVQVGTALICVGVSVGAAYSCGDRTDAEKMVSEADRSMYDSKRRQALGVRHLTVVSERDGASYGARYAPSLNSNGPKMVIALDPGHFHPSKW